MVSCGVTALTIALVDTEEGLVIFALGMMPTSSRNEPLERLRSLVPESWRARLLSVVRLLRLVSDSRSYREYRRLERVVDTTHRGEPPASLRIRALRGTKVAVRPGTTDLLTLVDTFGWAYHAPPPDLDPHSFALVWDLGSNVGFTIAHLAQICPSARIIGVELDPENAAQARTNIAPWSDRCEIIEAAVWTDDGTLDYCREAGQEWGFRVAALVAGEQAPNASASSISLNTLAQRASRRIDFVKMDIEGAETHVLRENTEWAARVDSIKVEVHDPYTIEDCAADLDVLGFETARDLKHHACVTGTRRSAA